MRNDIVSHLLLAMRLSLFYAFFPFTFKMIDFDSVCMYSNSTVSKQASIVMETFLKLIIEETQTEFKKGSSKWKTEVSSHSY
jgi:hypothetical protein